MQPVLKEMPGVDGHIHMKDLSNGISFQSEA